MPGPLAGLRVLEAADRVDAAFCGRQFALWGAEVLVAERGGGSALRSEGPRLPGGGSALAAALGAGKRRLEGAPPSDLTRLLGRCDVLVCGEPAELALLLGAELETLRRRHPDLVVVSLTDFGLDGPDAGRAAGVHAIEARSGYLSLSGPTGGPATPMPGRILPFSVGVNAFLGALGALIGRRRHGGGDLVEVSALETVAQYVPWLREQGQGRPSAAQAGTPEGARVLTCRDGALSASPGIAAHWPAWRSVLGLPGGVLTPEILAEGPEAAADRAAEALAPYLCDADVQPLFTRLQAAGVPCGPVQSLAAVLDDPQLSASEVFEPIALGDARRAALAGRPAGLKGGEGSAPTGPWTSGEPGRRGRSARLPPLEGLRVLDLTQAWIGPMAVQALADLGADVVKIENPARPDVWRLIGQGDGGDPRTAAVDRSWYFNGVNRNKRSLALNLSTPAGADLFRALVRQADLVMENFTPRVMPKLGLAYPDLARERPDLVMVSFSGLGADGPLSDGKANGASIEALAGWSALVARDAGQAHIMGAYPADPICGLQMAACALVALWRLTTGAGGHMAGSMLAAAAGYICDELLAASAATEVVDGPPLDAPRPLRPPSTWAALADPQLEARGFFSTLTVDGVGPARLPGRPWRFHEAELPPMRRAPRLGEHTAEVLKTSLGFDGAELARLRHAGVVA